MANGVNVKMGVSGVAQFKQNMNQAKQSVKTLDAQLALTEKQFKASGDAEEYMAKKTAELQAKMEAQKSVVENAEKALQAMAEKGVERSSTAYQKLYQEMLKAKGELLDTENALNGVQDAGDKAADGVSEMNAQLGRIGEGVSIQNVTSGLKSITDGLENAAKKAVNLGRKIFDAMMGAGSYADDLKTRAATYGLSTDELQRMDKTANLIDTSVDSIINAQKKLKKGIGSADEGVMGAFADLIGGGYDPRSRGWENAFWDAGEALMKFADEEEKEVYAQKLFGRSWNELIPLFEAGREQYEETNASWKVLSDEQIESLSKMDDEYQKLQENVNQLKMSILAEFAEPMADLMTTINEKVAEFSEWLQSDDGKAVVDSVVGKVKEAIEWISDPENIQTAIDALKTIAVGWAAIKLTGGALDLLKLITGAKTLLGGGKTPAGGAETATATSAAASGGWWTGVSNGATALSGKLSSALLSAGGLPAVTWDMFLNQTNAGRSLRDGGDVIEGLKQDVDEFTESVERNAETFESDWQDVFENNPFFKPFFRRDENADAAERLGTANWAPSYMGGSIGNGSYNAQQSIERMEQVADNAGSAAEKQTESNSEMTTAANNMNKLPGQTADAVRGALNGVQVVIDGPGLTAVIGSLLAEKVLNQ